MGPQLDWLQPARKSNGKLYGIIGAAAVVVIAALVVALLVVGGRSDNTAPVAATTESSAATSTTTSEPSSETSTESSAPSSGAPSTPHTGGPGSLPGATYGPGDSTIPMNFLSGIPFSFDVPTPWICATLDDGKIKATAVANCAVLPDKHAAGVVGIQRCAAGACTQADSAALSEQVHLRDDDWQGIDPDTKYANVSGTIDNQPAVRIGMFYRYASVAGGAKDTIAFTVLTGDPKDRDTMCKIANEIRTRAAKTPTIPS